MSRVAAKPCTTGDFACATGPLKRRLRSDKSEAADPLVEKIEAMDRLLQSWEQSGYDFCDKQFQNFVVYARGVHDRVRSGHIARAEAITKYLDQVSFGRDITGGDLVEKMSQLVAYLESALEESRLAGAVQTALGKSYGRLLDYDELPEPWQENPYVRHGYRFIPHKHGCVRSILSWHNETLNIWSHMLGIALFLYLSFVDLPSTTAWQVGTWMDRVPMVIFMVAAMKCLFCSILWHSFNAITHLKTKRRMACIDYTGISVCICASILTTEYSVLNCHPVAQLFYVTLTLACGAFGIFMNWHPMFDKTGARALRALFFSCFAIFGGVAGLHACIHRGVAETFAYYVPVIKSLLCYGTGILFYATLFPEKFFDGFDLCGASHQIWHAFVVGGVYFHYKAMVEIFGHAVNEACHLPH